MAHSGASFYVGNGPMLDVRVEDVTPQPRHVFWATCPGCPNWTVAADTWDELFSLVAEWHASDAPHRAWRMVSPWRVAR